jgi:hypothetical protein
MRAFTIVFVALMSLLFTGPFSAAQDQQKISRLPPLPQPLDPTLQEMFDKRRAMGGSIINLTLTQGHAEQVAHGGNVDDATFDNFAKFFSPQEIVEITFTVGSYYSTGLFTKALKIEVETDSRLTVAGKC